MSVLAMELAACVMSASIELIAVVNVSHALIPLANVHNVLPMMTLDLMSLAQHAIILTLKIINALHASNLSVVVTLAIL
jgi:hypothetical protein